MPSNDNRLPNFDNLWHSLLTGSVAAVIDPAIRPGLTARPPRSERSAVATTQPAGVDRPPTIHDIAALCGVAASTVSRALSSPDRVNIRTRQRIEAAAAQLHYIPNSQAKALSSGRTGAVGVLVPDITNP